MTSTFLSLPPPQVPLVKVDRSADRGSTKYVGLVDPPWLNYLKTLDVEVRGISDFADDILTYASGINAISINRINLRSITSTTIGSFAPTAGYRYALVFATGGGGGGGGAKPATSTASLVGGGGGSGAICINFYDTASLGTSATVLVGSGGAGGTTAGDAGTDGAATIFTPQGSGASPNAGGGAGGTTTGFGSSGGVASSGSIGVAGGYGGNGFYVDNGTGGTGGQGGASWWGSGGRGGLRLASSGASQGASGQPAGSGGGGGVCINSTAGGAGGTGASGRIMVIEFITT